MWSDRVSTQEIGFDSYFSLGYNNSVNLSVVLLQSSEEGGYERLKADSYRGSNPGGWPDVFCASAADGIRLPAGRCSSVGVSMRRREQVNLQTIIPLKEDQP